MSQDHFNFGDEREARDRGMGRAAFNNPQLLALAREHAFRLARHHPNGETSIEEVREEMIKLKQCHSFGNWMGSVFKGDHWLPAGIIQTWHHQGHARIVRKWRLKAIW